VASWAETYARATTPPQRHALLESAVKLVAAHTGPIPLRQYAALLDLSFGLGFHTDALARLRETYGFQYVDHAKDARPRSADRGGGATPLFDRSQRAQPELLGILGLSGDPTRQEVGAAYRKLAARHHPDRFHGASLEEQNAAAARFIELTRAYEELLLTFRD
jgi:outer membrane receptor protein involved in Fe transport